MAAVGSAWLRPAWADELDDTIALFKKNEETAKFFSGAHGYAVFPKIFKGAIGVGVRAVTGAFSRRARSSAIPPRAEVLVQEASLTRGTALDCLA